MTEPIPTRSYGTRGPSVVVLHGGPGAPGSARELAEALSGEFQVLEPLQRRSGGVSLTVERHVNDLAQVAPPISSVVGWSWGAMLALSYSSLYPERVSAVALVGCGTYDTASRASYKSAVANCLGDAATRRVEELRRQLASTRSRDARNAVLAELGSIHMEAEMFECMSSATRGLQELPHDEAGNRETWDDALRLQRNGTEPARFAAITAPVLMLHGDTDPHPGPATRDVLRQFLPQLEYVEFGRCGHQPWLEKHARDAFLNTLTRWLLRCAA